MIRFYASFPKLGLGAAIALAAISLTPGSAQAFVVTVGGVQYDVTTFTGTYNANTSKFNLTADGGQMPWWSSSTSNSAAINFATAVGNFFGPNIYYVYYDREASWPNPSARFPVILWQGSVYTGTGVGANESRTFAVASLVPAPVPGPLPILGVGAAFGFSRKLRKRIKKVPGALGSHLPQV